jgi:uncharacterized surface protein with fasciclin (FAS1) repeats
MKLHLLAGCALALTLGLTSAANSADDKDIVDVVLASKDHTVLAAAVKEAGLVEMLKGKGPLTVFAPTDAAFKKLGDDTIQAVLKDKEKLKSILLVHAVEGKVMAADVAKLNGREVKTVGGTSFKVDTTDGVKFGNAKVIKADIAANNGVVHVIDTVLLPSK